MIKPKKRSGTPNRYFADARTGLPLRVRYEVCLTIPAIHEGSVEIEASSEAEAIQLALGERFGEIWWHHDYGDQCNAEVFDIECEHPPADAVLVDESEYVCINDSTVVKPMKR